MRPFLRCLAVLVVGLSLSPSQARSQNTNVYAWSAGQKFKKHDYEGALADITKAIRTTPAPAEKWYVARAQINEHLDRIDDGIRDCDAALKLLADDPHALWERGFLNIASGNLEGAMSDLSQSIARFKADPAGRGSLSHVYTERGIAKEANGSFADAEGDFEAAVGAAMDEGAYPRFHLDLLLRRLGKADSADPYLANVPSWKDGWPKTVGLFLSNSLPEAALMSEAEHADNDVAAERLCEAYYYAGMQHLLGGDAKEAAKLFTKSVGTGVKHFNEYSMARYELERLEPQQK